MKILCDVCGNEREPFHLTCPFCGSRSDVKQLLQDRTFVHKSVNLETGRPVVELALNRMDKIIKDAAKTDVNVLTLIHGYGSSGKGGVIRLECRKMLDYMKSNGLIRDYIGGEEFNKRSGPVKSLLGRYPQLGSNKNLNKGNRGITLVIFSFYFLALPMLNFTTQL